MQVSPQDPSSQAPQEAEFQEAESQAPDQEAQVSQEPQEAAPEESAETASPDGEQPQGEEEKTQDEAAETSGKHKRAGGFRRQIERLERQVAEKDALLAQALARLPQQPGGDAPSKDPAAKAAEQFNNLVSQQVQQVLAAKAQQEAARQLQDKWEKQIPQDEEEAYEARRGVAYAHTLREGPIKEALLTSEFLPKIMTLLSRNPLELARISALPEAQAAREIGRLEAQFASGAAPVKPSPVNRPPAPPSKVNGGVAPSTRSIETLPIYEYKKAFRSGRR